MGVLDLKIPTSIVGEEDNAENKQALRFQDGLRQLDGFLSFSAIDRVACYFPSYRSTKASRSLFLRSDEI